MKRASLLLALVLAQILASCSTDGGSGGPPDGAALYQQQGCLACHGLNRQGSGLAPTLAGLTEHWTAEQLIEYLTDPQAYAAGDERLREQGKAYRQPMPAYGHLGAEKLQALATWLLAPGG